MIVTKIIRILLITVILGAGCYLLVSAETIKCTECGMFLDMNSKFTSKIVQGGSTLYFCDIGDLFLYLKRKDMTDVTAQVKDYVTGEWLDAKKAYFVHAEKKFMTPMGWGIAAFKDKTSAAESGTVMDFNATVLTIK